jgi:putative transposase
VLSVVNDDAAVADGRSMLDEICREGAQAMLASALEAEVDAYLAELVGERDGEGHRLATRNGHARSRTITTVAGAVEILQPRVNDRRVDPETGERAKFTSSLIPPWCRKSPKVTEVLRSTSWPPSSGW